MDVETGDSPAIFGGLALRIVEVRRNRDHCLGNLFPEVVLRRFLHLHQDHGGDFLGGVRLVSDLYPGFPVVGFDHGVGRLRHVLADFVAVEHSADEAFNREDGVLAVGDGLSFGHLADQSFARLGEPNHRRRRTAPFRVWNHNGLATIHDGDARVGCAEIDADDLAHVAYLPSSVRLIRQRIVCSDQRPRFRSD